jgi:hypothetical protein
MADPQELHYVDRFGVPYFHRKITRLVRPWLHQEGHNGTNLRADIEEMLQENTLDERDVRHLSHILQCCVRLDDTQPDGLIVSMNNKQFSRLVGIRRRFIEDRRKRPFDRLTNYKTTPIEN